jgi:5-formyltetrahydrofolate cyclo-ligase
MDPTVASWRREQRSRLLAMRRTLPSDERQRAAETVAGKLDDILETRGIATIGLYWPIKLEINLLPWATRLDGQGNSRLGLPVVVTPKAPLEYWRWTPGDDMVLGSWNIPVPARREMVVPELLLAPLVGFDHARYRLGYGSGYFD